MAEETVMEEGSHLAEQLLIIVRHGDRWDYSHPEWRPTAKRPGDPPLSPLGHAQARETGHFLDEFLRNKKVCCDRKEDLEILCSPFLRCVQTANEILNQFVPETDNRIKPESSVWEIDGQGGKLHADLPTLEERECYFPRLETNHESLFVPDLPERKEQFVDRCDAAVVALNNRYTFKPKTAIVVVSHPAVCVALARAASQRTLAEVNPAGPCAIYCLTRTSPTSTWLMDHHSSQNGLNGHVAHLTDMGPYTAPCPTAPAWDKRFQELVYFKELNGHTNVSTKSGPLGSWVNYQRIALRQLEQGKKSALAMQRREKLESIGFTVRCPPGPPWDERFQALVDFKELNGHTNVITNSSSLGRWVNAQRKAFRLYREGKDSPLTNERREKLESIGFSFRIRKY